MIGVIFFGESKRIQVDFEDDRLKQWLTSTPRPPAFGYFAVIEGVTYELMRVPRYDGGFEPDRVIAFRKDDP